MKKHYLNLLVILITYVHWADLLWTLINASRFLSFVSHFYRLAADVSAMMILGDVFRI